MKKLLLVAAALVALTVPAFAIDFTTPIMGIDGKPMTNEDKTPITLKNVAVNALLASYPDETSLSGEDKKNRWVLAIKIGDHQVDPALTADDIALLKKLIGKAYSPLVVGQAWSILDPASIPK